MEYDQWGVEIDVEAPNNQKSVTCLIQYKKHVFLPQVMKYLSSKYYHKWRMFYPTNIILGYIMTGRINMWLLILTWMFHYFEWDEFVNISWLLHHQGNRCNFNTTGYFTLLYFLKNIYKQIRITKCCSNEILNITFIIVFVQWTASFHHYTRTESQNYHSCIIIIFDFQNQEILSLCSMARSWQMCI